MIITMVLVSSAFCASTASYYLLIFTVNIGTIGFPAFEQVRMGMQARSHCFEVYKSSKMPLQPI